MLQAANWHFLIHGVYENAMEIQQAVVYHKLSYM
jgi:hypothetical protein